MKYIVLILLLGVLVLPVMAQVQFFEGTLEEALQKAKEEKKEVFVDFWADWCGPCKMMTAQVFPRPEVGEYFNSHFVCIKLNLEEKENQLLGKQYGIKALPTMVFLSADGKEIHRLEGTAQPEGLIHEAKIARGEIMSFSQIYDCYKQNKKDLDLQQQLLLEAPAFMVRQQGMDQQKWQNRIEGIFSDYLKNKKLKHMINKTDFMLLNLYHPSTSKEDAVFDFVAANFNEYARVVGRDEVAQYLIAMNNSYIIELCKKGDKAYRERLGRVNGDLEEAYAGFSFGELSVLDAITLLADATYALYRHELPVFFENMDKYFAGKGEQTDLNDYTQPLEDMAMAYAGKIPPLGFERSIPWIGKALEKNPDPELRTRLLIMLGQCLENTGQTEKAKQSYNQAFLESAQIPDPMAMSQLQQTIRGLMDKWN